MKPSLVLLSALLVLFLPSAAYACTSFALYGSQTFYGMNFDYFAIPMKFIVESRGGMNIFHLTFLFDQTVTDPEFKGYFAKTCGMNTRGLFCASQEIEPFVQGQKHAEKGEIHIDDHYEALYQDARVPQVKERIRGTKWIQSVGPSIHNLFADINGCAMVTETDNTLNFITEMDGDFMVMANFANHSLKGKSYKDARGTGAQRFITAHEFLAETGQDFSVEQGFSLLKNTRCRESNFETLSSMVFQPGSNTVYIALDLNMDRIWKIDIASKVLETVKGHRRYEKRAIDENGILSEDLARIGL